MTTNRLVRFRRTAHARSAAFLGRARRFLAEHGRSLFLLAALPLGVAEVVHQVDVLAIQPVQAAFFSNACNWMSGFLAAANGGAVQAGPAGLDTSALVFNILRGIFILYVAYSLVQVIKSARDSEDWQATARTPLIVILSVGVADLVTTLLLPAAEGAGATGC